MNIRISQIPKTPQKLVNFILSLEDGGRFTIPEMQKETGFSWHTCDLFIKKCPERFRPSIVGRSKGPGRPFIYKLLSNGADVEKKKPVVRVGKEASLSQEGWNRLPSSRKIRALEALFPDGIKLEQYSKLFDVIKFLEIISSDIWDQKY